MHSIFSYILAGGAGVLLVYIMTRAPELRTLRLSQFIIVPLLLIAALSVAPDPDKTSSGMEAIATLLIFGGTVVSLGIVLSPNVGHICGNALMDFLENADWTPAEEEIALRPIRQLIARDLYQEAEAELEELLKKHKPTYEALHLRAKLENYFQHYDETIAALLQMIPLSNTPQQQLVVMELLASLEEHEKNSSRPLMPGARPIRISHELVLLDNNFKDGAAHKEIAPGEYQIEEILKGRQRWLVLKGEPWGNNEKCWEAVREIPQKPPSKKGFIYQVVRLHQAFALTLKGKRRIDTQANSRVLLKEANRFIREGNWAEALPLLEKASADDPDSYEIAYRFVQAAFRIGPVQYATGILTNILSQSRWTESEERMLKQLRG